MKVLVVGDSQAAGPPGMHMEQKLVAAGHQVQRIGNPGLGPYDYVRMPNLWSQYTTAVNSFSPDAILLVFGSNDLASRSLEDAMGQLKSRVRPRVYYTGPPRYAAADAQARGESIKAIAQRVYGTSRYIDAYPFTGPEAGRAPDGLHFTRAGGEPWGQGAVNELLRRESTAGPLPGGRNRSR